MEHTAKICKIANNYTQHHTQYKFKVEYLHLEMLELNLKYLQHYSLYHVVIHFASISSSENLALDS